jgi:ubiquinone/menaquinone biosynthesis C-methylase UbiE
MLASTAHVIDFSAVPGRRYAEAQHSERGYWSSKDPQLLYLHAAYYYYAGYYEWMRNRSLLNPFSMAKPQNFQISGEQMEGRTVLDVGCGPQSPTLSLVHCARVHVVDPLADFYREIQPFGWEFFSSVSAVGGEQLPFDSETVDFVHCWNALDHTREADRVLREIGRVLRPGGDLLLACDVRDECPGGAPHPYHWSVEAFKERVCTTFKPIGPMTLLDDANRPVASQRPHRQALRWVARLRKPGRG